MRNEFKLLAIIIVIFGVVGFSNAASLDVTNTDVVLSGTDGIKDPGGNYVTVPPGVITMWSGSIAAIPAGWALCNGSNGTPDLTDRFVIPADADSGGANDVGDTGGSNTISEANLPAHTHDDGTLATSINGNHTHTDKAYDAAFDGNNSNSTHGGAGTTKNISTDASGIHNHNVTGSTGSTGSGTDYKPKYYALAFIMKL